MYSPDEFSFSQHGDRFVVAYSRWTGRGYIQAYAFDGFEWQPQGDPITGNTKNDGYGYVVSMAADGQSFVQYDLSEIGFFEKKIPPRRKYIASTSIVLNVFMLVHVLY